MPIQDLADKHMDNFNKNFLPLWFAAGVAFLMLFASETKAFNFDTVISEDEYCMALNIYHEARSENMAGQFAVADVVLNRVNHRNYPSSVCGVVRQAELSEWWLTQGREVPVRDRCQFSWYCDGKKDDPMDGDAWSNSLLIATQILRHGLYTGLTEGSTHYHADYITPFWAPTLHQVGTIGSHIFYRAD